MKPFIPLGDVCSSDRARVGGKCHSLSVLHREGIAVPATVCITTGVYDRYLSTKGLRERIQLELNRRSLDTMRWEEIWDASLRIRQLFLQNPLPRELADSLWEAVVAAVGTGPFVVRSSAPGEDSASRSFAGIHESFVNVRGREGLMEHLRLVWASLYSDSSLLYRREQHLDVERSTMAAAVQEFIAGERSGVAFSVSPSNNSVVALEAVHGLNEGLVDGTIDPDRWTVDRSSGAIRDHRAGERRRQTAAAEVGTALGTVPEGRAGRPPLTEEEAGQVAALALRAEDIFGAPQDMEWTFAGGDLTVLQSRPITTLPEDGPADQRGWYLSLSRSLENLRKLREKIEEELVPAMSAAAAEFAKSNLGEVTDRKLVEETRRRIGILERWQGLYREFFIPFAHGMRLFGQVYNQTVRPRDPYEFFALLPGEELESLRRNRLLEEMASRLRSAPPLADMVRRGAEGGLDEAFLGMRNSFLQEYGDLSCRSTGALDCGDTGVLDAVLLEMAARPAAERGVPSHDPERLRSLFLERYGGGRIEAEEILSIARSSYRLRDNDNIYLGRIEAGAVLAAKECLRRLREEGIEIPEEIAAKAAAVMEESAAPRLAPPGSHGREGRWIPRQLVGQPAGPGVARGQARVITGHSELARFRHGEVLVCDAVDPNMTFVVPLAAAVVERRGGMLIHGAIIAREYGLPCVTGVPEAATVIRTGDTLFVDGFLGIVTVSRE